MNAATSLSKVEAGLPSYQWAYPPVPDTPIGRHSFAHYDFSEEEIRQSCQEEDCYLMISVNVAEQNDF